MDEKSDEKSKLMKSEWKTKREKRHIWEIDGKEEKKGKKGKSGKSKEKGKERRQSKKGREKINNLEKTRCQVTCKPYQLKMEKENDVLETFWWQSIQQWMGK